MPYKNKKKQQKYQKNWHLVNYRYHRLKKLKINKENKLKVWKWFREYKSTLQCSNCPENHPACLDFHHRDPKKKRFGIALGARCGLCIKTLLKEIAKCDVLCANCHRKLEWAK